MNSSGEEFAAMVRAAEPWLGRVAAHEYARLVAEWKTMGMIARYQAQAALAGEYGSLVDALNKDLSYDQYCRLD